MAHIEHAAIYLRLAQLGLPTPTEVQDSATAKLVAPILAADLIPALNPIGLPRPGAEGPGNTTARPLPNGS